MRGGKVKSEMRGVKAENLLKCPRTICGGINTQSGGFRTQGDPVAARRGRVLGGGGVLQPRISRMARIGGRLT